MKKIVALMLALVLTLSMAACGSSDSKKDGKGGSDLMIGVVLIGDENEGYSFAHIDGIKKAAKNLGIADKNIVWKYSIKEDNSCYEAIKDCISQGCTIVITNSYGHQSFAEQAAKEFPDVTIVAMTGDTAKKSGLKNFKNAFTGIYQSRYVSGVVAGMKIAELDKAGKLTAENKDEDGNVKVGYVGAYPYAEVVSGYTAFYLGIKSVYPEVSMKVSYTNSWFDITAEGTAAEALLADGCVIIGQHADSTGAPQAVQAALQSGKVCYSVGYNVDMLSVAPDAALTSATNNWAVYYEYAFQCMLDGKDIDTDWAEGYSKDAVAITKLGGACAEGTDAKVKEVEAALKDGSLQVFDTKTFTVGGEECTHAFATDTDGDWATDADEAIIDGYYHESYFRAAPAFDLRIDGIKELN